MNRQIVRGLTLSAALVFLSAASAGPLRTSSPESVGMSSAQLERVTDHLQQLVDEGVTGGYQVLVARHGKVVMHENIGMANIEENRPISDDSLFRIFSMTKPITGVAMMMLYEEGYFSLADPVAKHIPEFAALQVYAGTDDDGNMILEAPNRAPTIEDLMQHTAGFTYGIFGDHPVDRMYQEANLSEPGTTTHDFIEKLAEIPLVYHPGEKYVYSVATDIQGYLIEKWAGMPVDEFLQQHLFDPLGMDETSGWVRESQASKLATVYAHNEDGDLIAFPGQMPIDHFTRPTAFSGGGQLISTTDDYWLFAQMLLNGGEFDGKRYLSRSSVNLMSTGRVQSVGYSPDGHGMGLNVNVIFDPGKVPYPVNKGEYDWGGLATTIFWIDPVDDMIVILMTQYFPTRNIFYRDLMHRLIRSAIIE